MTNDFEIYGVLENYPKNKPFFSGWYRVFTKDSDSLCAVARVLYYENGVFADSASGGKVYDNVVAFYNSVIEKFNPPDDLLNENDSMATKRIEYVLKQIRALIADEKANPFSPKESEHAILYTFPRDVRKDEMYRVFDILKESEKDSQVNCDGTNSFIFRWKK